MFNIADAQLWLMALLLTVPRLLVAFAIMPILVEPVIPGLLRNGIIVVLSLVLLPLTYEQTSHLDMNLMHLIAIVVKEGTLGLLLGYTFSIPFWAVKATGFLIDMQRGVMSAIFYSPANVGMTSPLGNLLGQMMTTLLLASGGFLVLLDTLFLSYQIWPIGQFMPLFTAASAKFFLQQFDLLMYTTLLMVGPLMGIMLLIDIGAGLVGRYLPQLNIFLLAMPIKSGVAFFMLTFYMVFIADYLKTGFLGVEKNLHVLDALLR